MTPELKKMIDDATARKLAAFIDTESDKAVATLLNGSAAAFISAPKRATPTPFKHAAPFGCWLALTGKAWAGNTNTKPHKVMAICNEVLAKGPGSRTILTHIVEREFDAPKNALSWTIFNLVQDGYLAVVAQPVAGA